jgi:hypothetical protein
MRVDEKPGAEYRSVIKQFSLENCSCTPLPPVTLKAEFGVDLIFPHFIATLLKRTCHGRLQEISNLDGHEEGRLPRTVECELTEDLVNACIPGDIVTVCGIVEIINPSTDVGSGGGKYFWTLCGYYMSLGD